MTPIMGVLTIYHSRRDMYGNVYYAVSLANDQFEVVASGTIAADNVDTRDCREQLGWHIERVEMPIRDYNRLVKKWPHYGCRWEEIKQHLVKG
mgnify:FL=1